MCPIVANDLHFPVINTLEIESQICEEQFANVYFLDLPAGVYIDEDESNTLKTEVN